MRIPLLRLRIPIYRPWGRRGPLVVDAGWSSAVGRRKDNQDRCATGDGWAVLADGMGGHPGGARAATLAVEAAATVLGGASAHPAVVILEAVRDANRSVRAVRDSDVAMRRMGTTVTIVAAAGLWEWTVANLGDSPAWHVGAASTEQLTEDHNVAGELLLQGRIDRSEAAGHPGRRMLTKAVGLEAEPVPSIRTVSLEAGDRLVLASDGLGGGVDTDDLHGRLHASGGDSAQADADHLVEAAIEGGARDNVTVVVLRFT